MITLSPILFHSILSPDCYEVFLVEEQLGPTFIYTSFHCVYKSEAVVQRCSVENVLRKFAKFTGRHLCQSLSFNKVAGLICNFIKKETVIQVFSCEFCEFSMNTFFRRTLMAASDTWYLDAFSCYF